MITLAIFGNRLYSVEEFVARFGAHAKENGVVPQCPSCGNQAHPYGAHSPNVTSCFHHYEENPSCPLSSSPDPRWKPYAPRGWNIEQAKRLKNELCQEANLKQAYAVALKICGKLSAAEFLKFCATADRLNIWAYSGLSLAYVPYILVTLDDLPVDGERRRYPVRFVLHKPESGPIDLIWERPQECTLRKVFADSGNPVNNWTCTIPWDEAERARNNIEWISEELYSAIRRCCNHK